MICPQTRPLAPQKATRKAILGREVGIADLEARHLMSSAEWLQEAVLTRQNGNPDHRLFASLEAAVRVAVLGMASASRRRWTWAGMGGRYPGSS